MSLALPPDTAAHGRAIGDLLRQFGERFDYEVPPEWADAWWEEFQHIPIETLRHARDTFFASGEAWPQAGAFKAHVDQAKEYMRRQATGTSGCCDRGWVHTASGEQPCRHCRPEQHETWRRTWVPAARRLEHIQPDTILTFNPSAMVQQAKQLLHANDRRGGIDG